MPRFRTYFFALHAFEAYFRTGEVTQIVEGFPADAKVRRADVDAERGGIAVVVESDAFHDVLEGDVLPQASVTVRHVVSVDGFDPPLPATETERALPWPQRIGEDASKE